MKTRTKESKKWKQEQREVKNENKNKESKEWKQ